MTARALTLAWDPDEGCWPDHGQKCPGLVKGEDDKTDVFYYCALDGKDTELPDQPHAPAPSWCPFRAAPSQDDVRLVSRVLLYTNTDDRDDVPTDEEFLAALAAARRVPGRE